MTDTLNRFSNRVADYVKYRPGYPPEMLPFLLKEGLLTAGSVVADIGSGTGMSATPFLENGNKVYGIEPNAEMRAAAEKIHAGNKNFISVNGVAEKTGLPDSSLDLIIAAQAFHWFDQEKCRAEFKRILKPDGKVLLAWNDRRTDTSPFLAAYEKLLLEHGTDYTKVNHRNIDHDKVNAFFGKQVPEQTFLNCQYFDYDGLKGRLLSSSYVPAAGEPGFDAMIEALKEVFKNHNTNGKVTVEYDTRLFYGPIV